MPKRIGPATVKKCSLEFKLRRFAGVAMAKAVKAKESAAPRTRTVAYDDADLIGMSPGIQEAP